MGKSPGNIWGGFIASIAQQLNNGIKMPDIREAAKWVIISGGLACFYYGCVFKEYKKKVRNSMSTKSI